MEAFRKWNILPKDVRTVSEQTLSWNTPEKQKPKWIEGLVTDEEHRNASDDRIVVRWNKEPTRPEIFQLNWDNCRRLERRLKRFFAKEPGLYREFGLKGRVPAYDDEGNELPPGNKRRVGPAFEVQSVRLARRITPDGYRRTNLIVAITQRQRVVTDKNTGEFFWFRGGATLIIDTQAGKEGINYAIVKNSASPRRLNNQKEFISKGAMNSLRALYFGGGKAGAIAAEPFAMLHASREDKYDEWENG
jgi:hypothetical protein